MGVFGSRDFSDHEQVMFCNDPSTGLKAIIAIHNSNLGTAMGGCRMWPYRTEGEALHDVLRLSRGMTYKSALAGLEAGGGKSVIIGNPRTDKTDELFRSMGRFIESLGGRYVAAEDSGIGVADLKVMAGETRYVSGIPTNEIKEGGSSGDPSPSTAYGVFMGLLAAVHQHLGRRSLEGLRVAIQGIGNVGFRLAEHLCEAGARLWVTDIFEDRVERAVAELGAMAVGAEEIFGLDVDLFAPCALGGVLNDRTIPRLRAKVVAGAANNQLASEGHGRALMKRNILYAPDYAVNAGGVIDVFHQWNGLNRGCLNRRLEGIYDTLSEIFVRSGKEQVPPHRIADRMAEERFRMHHPVASVA